MHLQLNMLYEDSMGMIFGPFSEIWERGIVTYKCSVTGSYFYQDGTSKDWARGSPLVAELGTVKGPGQGDVLSFLTGRRRRTMGLLKHYPRSSPKVKGKFVSPDDQKAARERDKKRRNDSNLPGRGDDK